MRPRWLTRMSCQATEQTRLATQQTAAGLDRRDRHRRRLERVGVVRVGSGDRDRERQPGGLAADGLSGTTGVEVSDGTLLTARIDYRRLAGGGAGRSGGRFGCRLNAAARVL